MMLTYPANYSRARSIRWSCTTMRSCRRASTSTSTPSERSPYNTTVFSQNGYFVLRPDIVFQARNPGYSGLDCVTSAVSTVLAKVPDIDAKHVGNMGHSWGGYQSAFYAVHNHGTFAATIAGAPLTDLISMYGYTSGNSGLPETGHYETSQERMQVSLWEDPQAYIRNSTVLRRRLAPDAAAARGGRRRRQRQSLPERGALQLRPPAREERRVPRVRGRESQRRAPGEPGRLPAAAARVVRPLPQGRAGAAVDHERRELLARQRILKAAAAPGDSAAVQAAVRSGRSGAVPRRARVSRTMRLEPIDRRSGVSVARQRRPPAKGAPSDDELKDASPRTERIAELQRCCMPTAATRC